MIVAMPAAFGCLKIIRLGRLNPSQTRAAAHDIDDDTRQFSAGNVRDAFHFEAYPRAGGRGHYSGAGTGSTVTADRRWPDLLAKRLIDARPEPRTPGVLNLSLAGNRLNHEGTEPGAGDFPGYYELGPNALARLNEDVFPQTGVRTVITHLGINDIWMNGDSPEAIIASLRQLNRQVQARGLTSIAGTLMPYEGNGGPGVWTP